MLNTGILERIAKLWSDDIQQKQGWMLEAENVQLLQLQSTHWIASLEEGKVWLEEQLESFKHALHTSDTIINEQKSWISTLEEDRNYHIQQAENWQSEAHFWQQQAQGLEKYHAGAVEEGAVLRTERDALITERDALSAECDALSAERDALLRYNPIARMQRSMKKRRLHKKV